MRPTILILMAVSTAFALGGITSASAQSSTDPLSATLPAGTLAIVNGVAIPQARLGEALRASGQPDTPQARQFFKQELITRELLRQYAEKQNYDTKPEVQQAVSVAKVAAETELYMRNNVHPEPVSEAQVKARYDEVVGTLGHEEYKLRIISVADDAAAETVLAKIKAGIAFDALVRQYSIASSKEEGGEMPWVSFKTPITEGKTQGVPLPVAEAAIRLPAGGVTPVPIVVNNVRVIVKLEAKRATQVPAYDEMKDTIRQQLQAAAFNKAGARFVGGLVKTAAIQE